MRRHLLPIPAIVILAAVALLVPAADAGAQTKGPWGRISFFANGVTASDDGRSLEGFTEVIGSFTLASPVLDQGGTEYRLDVRTAAYPSTEEREARVSVYDGYVGQRFAGGSVNVRVGQMWLNELGALGSIGGALVEVSRPKTAGFKRIRVGAFGGLEPKVLETGYVTNVRKAGGYVAFDGEGAWRNVVGVVTLRNAGLTERTVVTTTNFLPIGKRVFVYQAAEVDLTGPAGNGSGGLSYFFTNARVSPSDRIEIQGTFHRGRSIDTRTITLDRINGRPVAPGALEGLLFESAQGRVTVRVAQGVRVFGGYSRDRNNREDSVTGRTTFGLFATDILKTGLDVRVSDNRVHRPGSTYDAWDASIGRNVGPRVYLSVDYSSSLAVLRVTTLGGFVIESRPRTTRYAVSGNINATRRISLLVTGERLRDGTLSELRWMSGVAYRF